MAARILLSTAFALLVASPASAKDLTPDERESLKASMDKWVRLFNDHNVDDLATQYTEDADVTTATGDRLKGRSAVKASLADHFAKNPNVKVKLSGVQWRRLADGLVVEDGTWMEKGHSELGLPTEGRYTAVLSRHNDDWLVLHDRAFVPFQASQDTAKLEDLQWMLGTWHVSGTLPDGTEFDGRQRWRWFLDKNFMVGTITSQADGELITRATVFRDPINNQLRGVEFWRDGYQGGFRVLKKGTLFTGRGAYPDGRTESFQGKLALADDKQSFNYKARLTSGDGEASSFAMRAKKQP